MRVVPGACRPQGDVEPSSSYGVQAFYILSNSLLQAVEHALLRSGEIGVR